MNGRVLLDTNVIMALFARDEAVLEGLDNAVSAFVPSIVVGELFYGAYRSRRLDENMTRVEEFASGSPCLTAMRPPRGTTPRSKTACAKQDDRSFAEVEELEILTWQ